MISSRLLASGLGRSTYFRAGSVIGTRARVPDLISANGTRDPSHRTAGKQASIVREQDQPSFRPLHVVPQAVCWTLSGGDLVEPLECGDRRSAIARATEPGRPRWPHRLPPQPGRDVRTDHPMNNIDAKGFEPVLSSHRTLCTPSTIRVPGAPDRSDATSWTRRAPSRCRVDGRLRRLRCGLGCGRRVSLHRGHCPRCG